MSQKKVLILGGTMFVGRLLVEQLKTIEGYDVTLFNRGKSNSGLFADVKQIHGNREGDDIKRITEQSWDCVIDFSGYYPNTFEKLVTALKGKVGRYIFISTISVYDLSKFSGRLITEKDEILACSEAQRTSKLPDGYGEKKAEMERFLLAQDWLDKIIFRPSFIYGKYDWTERFYYWLYRARFADKILVPDGGTLKLSLTNAADLAAGLLEAIEIESHETVYNTISQPITTLRDMIGIASRALDREPEIVSLNNTGIKDLQLSPGDFPLFVPLNFMVDDSLWVRDFKFSRADVSTSFAEMLAYKAENGFPKPPVGLDYEKEQGLIATNFS